MRIRSHAANDNRTAGAPLFVHAGMLLPPVKPRVLRTSFEMPVAWQWRGLSIAGVRAERLSGEVQLSLAFPPAPPRRMSRAISPSFAAFMNITVCSYFGRDPLLRTAAEYLVKRGILYLGDLTRMTAGEIRFHFPSHHRALAEEFERRLAAIGLTLDARSSWWERPRDYYAIAY